MRRIALGRLAVTTSSFAPSPTLPSDLVFAFGGPLDAAALPELLGEEVAWVNLGTLSAPAGGPLTAEARQVITSWLDERLGAETLDGVLLALSGNTAAEDEPDVTGALLAQVREAVGPQVPVVAVLDVTANVTRRAALTADALVAGHTWPATDPSVGRRAAQVLADLLKVGDRPQVFAWKLPLLADLSAHDTARGLLAHVWEHLPTAETLPGMLSAALFMASPDLDVPELGWVFYQACYCDQPALDERAVRHACWNVRAAGAENLRARSYAQVSHPLYPLDDLDDMPLAAWAGDMINPCHCSAALTEEGEADGCGGCGKCCGRTP